MEIYHWLNQLDIKLLLIPTISIISILYSMTIDIVFKGNHGPFYFSEKKRIKKMKILLANENLDLKLKIFAQNELDSIAYLCVTGIRTHKSLQEKIVEYYEILQGRLSYDDFKKALSFLVIDQEEKLKIRKINVFDYFIQYYWFALTVLMLFFTSYLARDFIFMQLSFVEQINAGLTIIICFGICLISYSKTKPLIYAKKVRNQINSLKITKNLL